jgi:hypothetical protein
MLIPATMVGVVATIGLFVLVLGVLTLRTRATVMPSWVLLAFLGFCFLPQLVASAIALFAAQGGLGRGGGMLLLAMFMVALLLVFFRRIAGTLILYNVDEDALYTAVQSALAERGIEWEERRGRIVLKSLGLEIRLSTHGVTRTAVVWLPRSMAADARLELLRRMTRILAAKACGRSWYVGSFFCALGLLDLALAVFLALIFWSAPA